MKVPKYEERTALFLDYLGFRKIIEGSTEDPDLLVNINSAIDMLVANLPRFKKK